MAGAHDFCNAIEYALSIRLMTPVHGEIYYMVAVRGQWHRAGISLPWFNIGSSDNSPGHNFMNIIVITSKVYSIFLDFVIKLLQRG